MQKTKPECKWFHELSESAKQNARKNVLSYEAFAVFQRLDSAKCEATFNINRVVNDKNHVKRLLNGFKTYTKMKQKRTILDNIIKGNHCEFTSIGSYYVFRGGEYTPYFII